MLPVISLFGLSIPTFPIVIEIAILVSALEYLCSPIYNTLYNGLIEKMWMPLIICGALGARGLSALTLLTVSKATFLHNVMNGGAVYYGGLIGGAVGLAIISRLKRLNFIALSDVFASLLPLPHAIGRIGCYLNGCCYGKTWISVLAVKYPVDGVMTAVFPTWFVEAGFELVIFIIMRFGYRKDIIGVRTSIYLISYAVFRFLIEFMRGDTVRGSIGPLSSSQIISIPVFLFGICILHRTFRNSYHNYLFARRTLQPNAVHFMKKQQEKIKE